MKINIHARCASYSWYRSILPYYKIKFIENKAKTPFSWYNNVIDAMGIRIHERINKEKYAEVSFNFNSVTEQLR